MLETFDNMHKQLNDNSEFISDLDGIINKTQAIQTSTTVAAQSLRLMEMSFQANSAMLKANNNLHDCHLCDVLTSSSGNQPSLLAQVRNQLTSGVATALTEVRQTVKDKVDGPQRKKLQKDLEDAASPLRSATDALKNGTSLILSQEFAD